ncbi:hypothetical protein [Actinomadura rupiterrae]|uniref:hypothetical protein n=1 Tax=Actinomadura rupiterrae TaxID=559627 RepID=UPI0020A5408E|nr:hypothetical protein [Actinomadura rupiterrae]MCP2340150.1 molybdopterin-guanine dinucleotide biosynthesis protein A [Actinomadura rupiterrae]
MTDQPAPRDVPRAVRYAAVLSLRARRQAEPPPGVDADEYRLALLEDTYEVVAGLELVTAALVLDPPEQPDVEALTWPGTPIVREPTLPAAFAALHALGATEAALLAPDAPDLPPLLLGKLFRALGQAPAAACQAAGGGLVALAARLPLPSWLETALADADLDAPDALSKLRAAAPRPGQIPQGPSWHRLRTPDDVALLDPGLEGWESTRALLEGNPIH